MYKYLLPLFFLVFSFSLSGQLSLNGGIGSLKGFGVKKTFVGLNLGLEYPRSNQATLY